MFSFFQKKKKEEEIQPQHKQDELRLTSFDDVLPLAQYFKNETGVDFDSQLSILKSKMIAFCSKRSFKGFQECLDFVKKDALLKQELIDYLTTNETYFYREYKQIEKLVENVKATHSDITILCAPCSTGEEVYSIVIAFLEANIPHNRFSILGIDINQEVIEKAKNAVYNSKNLRNLSQELIEKYFDFNGSHYILKEFFKSSVDFRKMNIFDENFSSIGKFDFVFSRNMLIYFDKETKVKAKDILENLLNEKKNEIFFGHADLF
ncbi:MAG: protein-glutamate O-methyltransferase CheR [Thiovulaceae bacterium]|nr:protein-glutamate O-methyltransferase CheR [Sulfurimonadaceae bacterium]